MNNVKSAGLWDVIKKGREEQKYLNSWKPKKFDSYPDLEVNYLDKDWLGNVISTEKLRTMKPENPMLIAAQTGSGKSTLLLSKLLKIALAENKRILYLCSRSALAMKTKQDAIRDEINAEVFCGKRRVKELAELFTPQGLKERVNFGGVDVILYQNYIKDPSAFSADDFSFVFMDEAHFFTSDSGFIVQTYESLCTLIKNFKNTRRVYVTATPDECIDFIWREETENNYKATPKLRTTLEVFTMQEDYSYLKPCFFNTHEELISLIQDNLDKAWLVFVEDKKIGEKIQDALTIPPFRPMFITAETDKNSDEFQLMIQQEALPYKILISTRVLDVGINIRDKELNLAVLSNQSVEIKQQLGRKRLNSPNENVNVYFKVPSGKELSIRRRSVKKRISDIKQTLFSLEAGEYIEQIAPPFGIKGNQIFYNPLTMYKLKSELKNIENLMELLNQYEKPDERSLVYAKQLLQDFESVQYKENDLLIETKTAKLIKLISSYIGKTFEKDEFAEFAEAFKNVMGEVRSHPRDNLPSIASINKCICKYGFVINSFGSPVRYSFEKLDETRGDVNG